MPFTTLQTQGVTGHYIGRLQTFFNVFNVAEQSSHRLLTSATFALAVNGRRFARTAVVDLCPKATQQAVVALAFDASVGRCIRLSYRQ